MWLLAVIVAGALALGLVLMGLVAASAAAFGTLSETDSDFSQHAVVK